MGALHSRAAPRQSSSDITFFSDVEYSRIRPQPVHVRLHVCSGSSCSTVANFSIPRSLCERMCPAIFAVSARGNLMGRLFYKPCGAADNWRLATLRRLLSQAGRKTWLGTLFRLWNRRRRRLLRRRRRRIPHFTMLDDILDLLGIERLVFEQR